MHHVRIIAPRSGIKRAHVEVQPAESEETVSMINAKEDREQGEI